MRFGIAGSTFPWTLWSKWLRICFSTGAVVFLAYVAWREWASLSALATSADTLSLVLAVALLSSAHILSGLALRLGLKVCGFSINIGSAIAIHIVNLPARYVPGGIWHTVGRIVDLRRMGATPRTISSYVLLENMLAPMSALALGAALLCKGATLEGWKLAAGVGGIASTLALFSLPVVGARLGRWELDRKMLVSYMYLLAVLFVYWLAASVAFFAYCSAMTSATIDLAYIDVAGLYLVSWTTGFIAFFAPQGVGVFEWVMTAGLGAASHLGAFVAVVAGYRLVMLAADLLTWLLYNGLRYTAFKPRR